MELNPIINLENELEYLGLLDKAREIYNELGGAGGAVLHQVQSPPAEQGLPSGS